MTPSQATYLMWFWIIAAVVAVAVLAFLPKGGRNVAPPVDSDRPAPPAAGRFPAKAIALFVDIAVLFVIVAWLTQQRRFDDEEVRVIAFAALIALNVWALLTPALEYFAIRYRRKTLEEQKLLRDLEKP